MPKYENSVIYKLKHNEDYDDNNIYVGSTSNFKHRKNYHKSTYNNENDKSYNLPVYKYIRDNGGWENWVMIPIELYPCNSRKELEIRERHYIDLLKSKLNKNIPTRTNEEYREDNREQQKQYYNDNKTKIEEYKTKYYKQKVVCENCGKEMTKHSIYRHKKESKKCIESQKDDIAG